MVDITMSESSGLILDNVCAAICRIVECCESNLPLDVVGFMANFTVWVSYLHSLFCVNFQHVCTGPAILLLDLILYMYMYCR